ncbi:sphingosine-1-phosphate phosphatase 2 isoform X2 [Rhineura floridana]|uniref:sphingosine-1-phosphate phosphatase 2 isoform X2 n=1 Tax=Rhineura floridana TaxID=261503 RepID=UPI002AC864AF|nr:sphingosine-1-phosphate phosphatase 2 isoform X2 [Rhineura floridana]
MACLLRSLLGSQPVARFQRCCGLFPASEGGAQQAGAVGSDNHPLPARDVCNGCSPAKQRVRPLADCTTCNGSASASASNGWEDCSQEYVVKNYFYYYLFRISAAMGQEVFYITFLPFSYWSINQYVARRLIIMWSMVMYIGQVSKDLLKWPRPCSPPVVKLEKRTNAEYGMPSTHAMAATVISFTFVAATVNKYKYPLELGLMGAFLFSTLVCLSRIYTGMHTVLDVIAGSLISAILTALTYPTWDFVDHLILTSPLCPVFCIVVPLFLCYKYPKLDYYSPTRADTTTILGAGAGAIIGSWINNHYVSNALAEAITHDVPSITSEMLLIVLGKFLVGIVVLVITRQIIKNIALKLLCSWYRVSTDDVEAMQQIEIEVPYKFITYSSIGLSATVLVPLLHKFLELN